MLAFAITSFSEPDIASSHLDIASSHLVIALGSYVAHLFCINNLDNHLAAGNNVYAKNIWK